MQYFFVEITRPIGVLHISIATSSNTFSTQILYLLSSLLFSQSILALDMIENFLSMLSSGELKFQGATGEDKELSTELRWEPNKDYFRLDGSVSADIRKHQCQSFNSEKNERY